jgi:hypothetical protein
MNRVMAVGAGVLLVAGVALIVMRQGANEGQQSESIPKDPVAATTESGLLDANAVDEPKPAAPLASPDRDAEEARRRSAKVKSERRRRAIARIADLGYNDFDANRIRDVWEEVDENMTNCREQIAKEENGSLEFGAMRACDRSHMTALYNALGDPDDYRAALVGADRMTRVEIGVVDPGSYAESLGLEPGDQILQWEDQMVFEPADIRHLRKTLPDLDDKVILLILKQTGEIVEIETVGGRTGASLRGLK